MAEQTCGCEIWHGEELADASIYVVYCPMHKAAPNAPKLLLALEGMQEIVDMVLENYVLPRLKKAEALKHNDSKNAFEREREQGVADALRTVKIWLEDNEAVHPRADTRAAIHKALED